MGMGVTGLGEVLMAWLDRREMRDGVILWLSSGGCIWEMQW